MKVLIDIPEEVYKQMISRDIYKSIHERLCYKAIQDGTPIPKGHGRLIDADYLREDFKASKRISFAERMDISCIVDHAPTIIEADKEQTDESDN